MEERVSFEKELHTRGDHYLKHGLIILFLAKKRGGNWIHFIHACISTLSMISNMRAYQVKIGASRPTKML